MILNNVKLHRGIFILLVFTCLYGGSFTNIASANIVQTSNASGMYDSFEGTVTLDTTPAVPDIAQITVKVLVPAVAIHDPGNPSGIARLAIDTSAGFYESTNSFNLSVTGVDQYLDLVFTFPAGAQLVGDGLDVLYPYTDAPGFYDLQIQGSASDVFALGFWEGEELNGVMLDTYFLIEDSNVPAGPAPFVPLSFKFIATSSDLLASVGGSITDGVKVTGQSIWPLFAFLGVSIAFIIALQLIVFTKRTVGSGGAPKTGPYGPGGEHYKAFKRGRKLNKQDGIDLFPED